MFVITADQVDSRSEPDIVGDTLEPAQRALRRPPRPPRRPQRRRRDPGAHRRRRDRARPHPRAHPRRGAWSVGLGSRRRAHSPARRDPRGERRRVHRRPRQPSTRAKRCPTRFAVDARSSTPRRPPTTRRRSSTSCSPSARAAPPPAGSSTTSSTTGLTQAEAGARLGITPQSASDRARAARLRVELAALPPLTRLLDEPRPTPSCERTAA